MDHYLIQCLVHEITYSLCVPLDTTRPIRSGEVNSHDYFFITREEFEQEVQQDRFLEYGELRGHYYGTSYSSVKRVQEAGKVPVLDLNPQVYACYLDTFIPLNIDNYNHWHWITGSYV